MRARVQPALESGTPLDKSIDVSICTFRRESLSETLRSLAAQDLPIGMRMRVIVADNDAVDVRRGAIEVEARALGLDLEYIHAPERNISRARNACLDAAKSGWLAFIDDDEVARRDWLKRLLAKRAGQQIVFGVSVASYPDSKIPKWIAAGDFHSNRLSGNDADWNGYTANVLIDRSFVAAHNLRFDEALGQTGGEDTRFFFDAKIAGARFGYAPEAIVDEVTSLERASFRWLALRRFRSGQIHYLLLCEQGKGVTGAILAAAKAGACLAAALVTLPRPAHAGAHALRGALHVGVVAASFGFAPYREYGEPKPR